MGDISPWHMWGTKQVVDVPVAFGANAPTVQASQLARINYKRPESWNFFLFTEIVGSNDVVPVATVIVTVNFDLMFGVGRTNWDSQGNQAPGNTIQLAQNFVQFRTLAGSGNNMLIGSKKWTTAARSPQINDQDLPADDRILVEHFPAQDIQCRARVTASAAGGATPTALKVEIGAFFAPRTHVRPDWYRMQDERKMFRGQEVDGK